MFLVKTILQTHLQGTSGPRSLENGDSDRLLRSWVHGRSAGRNAYRAQPKVFRGGVLRTTWLAISSTTFAPTRTDNDIRGSSAPLSLPDLLGVGALMCFSSSWRVLGLLWLAGAWLQLLYSYVGMAYIPGSLCFVLDGFLAWLGFAVAIVHSRGFRASFVDASLRACLLCVVHFLRG